MHKLPRPSMTPRAILLSVALVLCLAVPDLAYAGKACSPSGTCTACKNCSGCKHCSKEGGTCSVCKPKAKTSNTVRHQKGHRVMPARPLR